MYTASQIEPGEELYVHYGKSYEPRRDYAVGAAACVRKCDISLAQMPANIAWLPNLPPDSWMPQGQCGSDIACVSRPLVTACAWRLLGHGDWRDCAGRAETVG